MPLTNKTIQNAKPGDKPNRLFDGGGLYLEVSPKGGKWWRLKYRFRGKEKRISLGVYPDVRLKEARDRRDDARQQLRLDIDPSAVRKAKKTAATDLEANSFESIAREWLAKFSSSWSEDHKERMRRRFEFNVFPWIGRKSISEVGAPELLQILRRIESKGAIDTAHRTRQNCGQVFRYAIATGRAERDVSSDLRGALPPVNIKHHPSITDPKAVGELLRALDGYQGSFITQSALRSRAPSDCASRRAPEGRVARVRPRRGAVADSGIPNENERTAPCSTISTVPGNPPGARAANRRGALRLSRRQDKRPAYEREHG